MSGCSAVFKKHTVPCIKRTSQPRWSTTPVYKGIQSTHALLLCYSYICILLRMMRSVTLGGCACCCKVLASKTGLSLCIWCTQMALAVQWQKLAAAVAELYSSVLWGCALQAYATDKPPCKLVSGSEQCYKPGSGYFQRRHSKLLQMPRIYYVRRAN